MSILRSAFITSRQGYALRALSTSSPRSKTVTETVKDTADSINKKIGKTLASGLDTVEKTTDSAKQTVCAKVSTETAESARLESNHALGKAAGKVRDAKDELEKKL
ncbi:hypothetical protein BCR39DRAFT_470584 [Naematelia encephala]|uniref:Uncharacterized protein n=1 Tax=Naematelia encephala TaxID=71784 RepID=A0A1Y2AUX4_9TREE|nr:hypothetical protein BCR39DRAFT_470584 [Naematelia encephala]